MGCRCQSRVPGQRDQSKGKEPPPEWGGCLPPEKKKQPQTAPGRKFKWPGSLSSQPPRHRRAFFPPLSGACLPSLLPSSDVAAETEPSAREARKLPAPPPAESWGRQAGVTAAPEARGAAGTRDAACRGLDPPGRAGTSDSPGAGRELDRGDPVSALPASPPLRAADCAAARGPGPVGGGAPPGGGAAAAGARRPPGCPPGLLRTKPGKLRREGNPSRHVPSGRLGWAAASGLLKETEERSGFLLSSASLHAAPLAEGRRGVPLHLSGVRSLRGVLPRASALRAGPAERGSPDSRGAGGSSCTDAPSGLRPQGS